MMKNYHIYVFTQDACPPCARLKDHCKTLADNEKAELDFVPPKQRQVSEQRWPKSLPSTLPTLVVTHETLVCDIDGDTDEEFCDQFEESVERIVGANNIIKGLQSTLDAYTYAHTE